MEDSVVTNIHTTRGSFRKIPQRGGGGGGGGGGQKHVGRHFG